MSRTGTRSGTVIPIVAAVVVAVAVVAVAENGNGVAAAHVPSAE